ncbi:sodium- and chloride-dependent glycine transporter 1 isoform X1 [Patella vulgata]|uniref:sodium- and chloride-dependent glycine transporter 1 isoform X1 n=1 Tax=Patella vulgata TaxID=6465 RepID=UPI00217F9522|nr:sodium- and chloride-dependent glycine transporter 1 isoform X1 [Patella vulgata]
MEKEDLKTNTELDAEQKNTLLDSKSTKTERGHWGSHLEFIFSLIGCCVGLGNLWRFPYICNRNGGGAFLIPYLTFLFLCGVPLYFLEVCMGQFSGQGVIECWGVCPLLKGVGYGMAVTCTLSVTSYIMVITWTLYYTFKSFSSTLPWTLCGEWWNTEYCTSLSSTNSNNTSVMFNLTMVNTTYINNEAENNEHQIWSNLSMAHTAGEEFWQYNALRISPGIEYIGKIEWHLVVCLLVAWIIVCLCLIKGVHSVGKIVYVTASLPYILLVVILIRGVTLPGAVDGIIFYLRPDFYKLKELSVWIEAALQIFYSLGPGWGVIITLSSYNKFKSNAYRDSIMVCLICSGTSIFGGLVIFSILGFMAKNVGISVSEVVSSGPGLVYIAYPQALSLLPVPQLWCFLFFLMLLSVGLDTQFCFLELAVSVIIDSFPAQLSGRRPLCTVIICSIMFLLGLLFCTQAGMYIFQIFDWYVGAFSVFCFGIIECVVFGWIYGTDKFGEDIEMMIGRKPPVIFEILWKIITPGILVAILISSCVGFKTPSYGKYQYPTYASAIGWCLTILCFLPVPIFMIKAIYNEIGSIKERLRQSIKPTPKWRPQELAEKCPSRYHEETRV